MMKAAVLTSYNNPEKAFEIRKVQKPILAEGEILIEVEAFGLNYADVMATQGLYKAAPKLPAILGYEVVGRVVEIFDESNNYWLGKRVVAMTRFGGYAEFAKTNVLAASIVKEDQNATELLALATQYVTAYYMTDYCGVLEPKNKALIHAAAGGVGVALTQLLKTKGIEVYGFAGNEDKKKVALENGVAKVINYKVESELNDFNKNEGQRIDYVFNSVGGVSFKTDYKRLNAGGKIFTYGIASMSGKKGSFIDKMKLLFQTGIYSPLFLLGQSKSMIGVNMLVIADNKPLIIKHCLEKVVRLLEEGAIKPIVGGEYHVDDIGRAHQVFGANQTVGKIGVFWKK